MRLTYQDRKYLKRLMAYFGTNLHSCFLKGLSAYTDGAFYFYQLTEGKLRSIICVYFDIFVTQVTTIRGV